MLIAYPRVKNDVTYLSTHWQCDQEHEETCEDKDEPFVLAHVLGVLISQSCDDALYHGELQRKTTSCQYILQPAVFIRP